MKKGFTLVEISIVLVIIGLLIGGILAARSMIETAKTQKLIKFMQQYIIAGRNFKTNYGYWPGDYPNAVLGCAGNGDGIVQYLLPGGGGANCTIGGQSNYEGSNYFVQLAKSGMTADNLDYNTNVDPGIIFLPGTNVPKGLEEGSMLVIQNTINLWNNDVVANARCIGMCTGRTAGDTPPNTSYMFYTNAQGASYPADTRFLVNILTAHLTYAVDLEIDDGMPNTGDVIGFLADQAIGEPFDATCGVGDGPYGTLQFQIGQAYDLSTTRKTCVLGIKLTN